MLLCSCLVGCPLISVIGYYGFLVSGSNANSSSPQAQVQAPPEMKAPPEVKQRPPAVQAAKPEVKPVPPPIVEPVLEPTPVKLALVHKLGDQHSVKFGANFKLTVRDPLEKEEHSFASIFSLRYQETTEKIDELQGKVQLRCNHQACRFDINYDKEEKVILMHDQEQIIATLAQVSSTRKLTRRNQEIDRELDFGQGLFVDPDLQKGVAAFHSSMTLLQSMITVELPDKEEAVVPGDSWSTSHSISMSSARNKGQSTTMGITYKYAGIRKRDNRDGAVINLTVHLLGKKGDVVQLKGDGEGEAILDLESGQISKVKLDLKLTFDTSMFVDSPFKANGTVGLTLDRDAN